MNTVCVLVVMLCFFFIRHTSREMAMAVKMRSKVKPGSIERLKLDHRYTNCFYAQYISMALILFCVIYLAYGGR